MFKFIKRFFSKEQSPWPDIGRNAVDILSVVSSQIKTVYPLTLREWKQWTALSERCSVYGEEAHRDHYRVSVEEFLNRYEVRNGCWKPRPTLTDKKVSKYVGTAILAGIVAGVVVPNTILAAIGGLFVGAALYKHAEKDQSKK